MFVASMTCPKAVSAPSEIAHKSLRKNRHLGLDT
jgi:hypothetical protein